MSVLQSQVNSKKQGDVGLSAAIYWFTANDYHVSIPLTDSQDYDLIADDGTDISRVQVKTTTFKTEYGIYQVNLAVFGGNRSGQTIKYFDPAKVDLVFILTDDQEMYLIPSDKIQAKKAINLGEKYATFRVS